MALTIAVLLPDLLNTNGDSENAAVLARRAEWAGIEVATVPWHSGDPAPQPDLLLIGSGNDADLITARDALRELEQQLRSWATEEVPLLAVGTGFELLSWGIETAESVEVEGLGIIPGRAVARHQRVSGDLVVDSTYGQLVGYENHARDYVGAEASPLGRVRFGSGNGRDSAQEGVAVGTLVGTHLHGPVLAKNPALADHLLRTGCERRGLSYRPAGRSAEADEYARSARERIVASL